MALQLVGFRDSQDLDNNPTTKTLPQLGNFPHMKFWQAPKQVDYQGMDSSFSYSLHTDHITKSFAHKTKRAPMKPEDPGERKPHGWEQMGRIINLERWENLEVALMKHITGTPIYYAYSSLPLVLVVFLNASSTSTYLQSKCTASYRPMPHER